MTEDRFRTHLEQHGLSPRTVQAFRKLVYDASRKGGRDDLPWRLTRDPYRIMVSEIMLQQTQVARVRTKYEEFLAAFPDVAYPGPRPAPGGADRVAGTRLQPPGDGPQAGGRGDRGAVRRRRSPRHPKSSGPFPASAPTPPGPLPPLPSAGRRSSSRPISGRSTSTSFSTTGRGLPTGRSCRWSKLPLTGTPRGNGIMPSWITG